MEHSYFRNCEESIIKTIYKEDWEWPACQPPQRLQNSVCRYRSSLFGVHWLAILYFLVTSLPFYLCRWWSIKGKGKWQCKLLLQNIYMYMIVTLEVVYDHVGKCRKLALCYFIQINLISSKTSRDWNLRIGNAYKCSHAVCYKWW